MHITLIYNPKILKILQNSIGKPIANEFTKKIKTNIMIDLDNRVFPYNMIWVYVDVKMKTYEFTT